MLRAILITGIYVGIAAAFARSDDSKIVGGRYVDDISSMPFIVSLQVKNIGHNCGGSLLTPSYVVSACHCLADVSENTTAGQLYVYDPEKFLFVAGATDFKKDMGYVQIRTAKAFYVHPKCSRGMTILYDFSAGEMKTPFQITERVKPFKLLTKNPDEFENKLLSLISKNDTVCQVAGWGETRRGSELEPVASSKLKAVRMFVISEKNCQELYGNREESFAKFPFGKYNQVCAVSQMKNESDCLGDSGSPFFCGDYVVGVVSYGYECGTYMPSVYTGLKQFLEWFMSEVYSLRPDPYISSNISSRESNYSVLPPSIRKPTNDAHRIGAGMFCGWLCCTIPSVLQALGAF